MIKGAYMIEFNIASEYSALAVILIVLISAVRDCEGQTQNYKYLKYMYTVVLLSIVFNILSVWFNKPYASAWHTFFLYAINILYFIFLPANSFCYHIYCLRITTLSLVKKDFQKKLILNSIPFAIYVFVLLTNVHNGRVFSISQEVGYVRGEWFQLPYVITCFNIAGIVFTMIKSLKKAKAENAVIIILNMLVVLILLYIQAHNTEILMTGMMNTICVLAVHLYIQNVRKSIDPLTGAKNKMAFRYEIDKLIRQDVSFSIYVFSIRGTKMINERYGFEIGDRVIVQTLNNIATHLSFSFIYRYNGDEFAVILKKSNKLSYDKIIRKVEESFNEPMIIKNNSIPVDIVYTRVDYKLFGKTANDLLSAIDYSISALTSEDNERKYLYDSRVVQRVSEKNRMVQQIQGAIENDLLEMQYHPIYSAEKKGFTQAGALVNIYGDKGVLLSPSSFRDVGKKTGLVVPIFYKVLRNVCRDLRRLIDTHGENLLIDSISLEFPYEQFANSNTYTKIMEVVNEYKIPPSKIKIEITEGTSTEKALKAKPIIEKLHREGFAFILNDFGINYSNIDTLLELAVSSVKIHSDILFSDEKSVENKIFFKNLVKGMKATGKTIIMEGVGDKKQLTFALSCGCNYIQGDIFSKPLILADLEKVVTKQS